MYYLEMDKIARYNNLFYCQQSVEDLGSSEPVRLLRTFGCKLKWLHRKSKMDTQE